MLARNLVIIWITGVYHLLVQQLEKTLSCTLSSTSFIRMATINHERKLYQEILSLSEAKQI